MSIPSQKTRIDHTEAITTIPNIIQIQSNNKKSKTQSLKQDEDTISNVSSITKALFSKRKTMHNKVGTFLEKYKNKYQYTITIDIVNSTYHPTTSHNEKHYTS